MTAYQVQSDPVYTIANLNLEGLLVQTTSGGTGNITGNTVVLTVGAGQCRDSKNVMDMMVGLPNLTDGVNQQLNGANVTAPLTISGATSGALGLDQGTLAASTGYYVYLIGSSASIKPTSALISLNKPDTGPVMPTGYDSWRMIGHVFTSSTTNFLPYRMNGHGSSKYVQYSAPISVLSGGTSTAAVDINLSTAVPDMHSGVVTTLITYVATTVGDVLRVRTGGDANLTAGAGQSFKTTVTAVPIDIQAQFATNDVAFTGVNHKSINYNVTGSGDSATIYVAGYQLEL